MLEILEKCTICPHNCGIDRTKNQIGRCKSKDTVKVALYSTHDFEEPCISGNKGSGTVFFSNCTMRCIYCQNYEISQERKRQGSNNRRTGQYFSKTTRKWCRKHKSSNTNKLCTTNNRGNKNSKNERTKITNSI